MRAVQKEYMTLGTAGIPAAVFRWGSLFGRQEKDARLISQIVSDGFHLITDASQFLCWFVVFCSIEIFMGFDCVGVNSQRESIVNAAVTFIHRIKRIGLGIYDRWKGWSYTVGSPCRPELSASTAVVLPFL